MYSGIIAALGNPGAKYTSTRHNMGFIFGDYLRAFASRNGSIREMQGKKFHSLLWEFQISQMDGRWLLAEPQTFMNESGVAVGPLLKWFNLEPDELIVAHDEMDIPLGQFRFKFGGGLAGHKGLASIAAVIGSNDFYRLRIGIGKPMHREDTLDWVLGRPHPQDMEKITRIMPYALETIFIFVQKGLQAAMQYAHTAAKELAKT